MNKLSTLSLKELVSEISERINAQPLVPDEVYALLTDLIPVVCIDCIPVDISNPLEPKIGVITRATGSQKGKKCLVGGRILKNESISQAIRRHLMNDLGVTQFTFFKINAEDKPFKVVCYKHADSASDGKSFDPTKNAFSLTYLVSISEEPVPHNEALEFHWVSFVNEAVEDGFNQKTIMQQALEILRNTP
ncbi:MAG: DUF4916 domain-containing protein [Candidatus Saccharimonadales bacterium]